MSNVEPITADPFTQLCRSFPTLLRAPGIYPWDPHELDAWASGPASHGGVYAARFVLAVWTGRMGKWSKSRKTPEKDSFHGCWRFNLDTNWRCGPFDVVDAMGTWDEVHRGAFLTWAQKPWWP